MKTTPKPSESKSDCAKSLEKEGQKSIPANMFGKERINCSQDPVKEPNELTRKPDENGIFLLPHQVHLRHGGNQQTNGGRHRVKKSQLQGVSFRGNVDSLVSDGEEV